MTNLEALELRDLLIIRPRDELGLSPPAGACKSAQLAPSGWSVVWAKDAAALAEHVPPWEALASQALEPNVFYEPWILLPAMRAFGAGVDFRVALVFAPHPTNSKGAPVLVGLFPFQRQRFRGLPFSVLSLWRHRFGLLGTPLVRADAARGCLDVLFARLAHDAQGGPLVEFTSVAADSLFYQALVDFLRETRQTSLVAESSTRALFRRRADSDSYLKAALSGESRKALRRKARRLAELGNVEYQALDRSGDCDAWLAEFLRVEASGWKGRAGTAMASQSSDRTFFEEVTRAAFHRGRLDLLGLHLDGRPIAYQCCLRAGDGAVAFKTGYDEAYAACSPGILIQIELIRRLHASTEIAWLDSNSDPDGYLNHLWPDRRILHSVLVATGRAPGELLVAALPLLRWLKRRLFGPRPHVPSAAKAPGQIE